MVVREFRGPFAFLSNFYPAPVELDGVLYSTVEHAYQAAKTTDPEWRARIRACPSPGAAKRMGRMAPLRRGRYEMRVAVMRELVAQKFTQHPELAKALLATGNPILVEGNRWGDQFWGVDLETMVGVNQLGKILMDVRAELAAVAHDSSRGIKKSPSHD